MTTERIDIVITERGGQVVQRGINDIGRGAVRAQGQVDLLANAFRGLVGVLSAREFMRMNDVYTNMSNRLKLVAGDTANLTRLTQEMFNVARDTRTSFEATATLYARVALSSKELGYSQRELINFVKGVNQAVQLSGVTAQEAHAGLIQFSQGLAKGRLDGDELRSVLEQLPFIADVIAEKLQINRFEMKEWGKEGKLTPKVIVEAFQEMEGKLTTLFSKLNPTFSQFWTVLRDQAMRTLGPISEQIGKGLGLTLAFAVDNLNHFTTGVAALIPLLAVLAGRAAIGAVISGLNLLRIALMRNPITAIATAAAGAIVTLGQMSTKMDEALREANKYVTFIDKFMATWDGAKAYIKEAWNDFPAWFANLTIKGINLSLSSLEGWAKKLNSIINDIAGRELFPTNFSLGRVDELEAPKKAGERAAMAFVQGYSQSLMDRAKLIGDLLPSGPSTFTPESADGKGGKRKTFAQIESELIAEINLLHVMGMARERHAKLLGYEADMKRELTLEEGESLYALLEYQQVLERQGQIWDEIFGPQENYRLNLQALNEEFMLGDINVDQYNQKLREFKIEILETDQTIQGGFLRGLLKVQEEFSNLSDLSENLVVNGIREAEDAFVKFARTGELSFKNMVDSILDDLARLVIRQNVTLPMANMLGEVLGFQVDEQGRTSSIRGAPGSGITRAGGTQTMGNALDWVGDHIGSRALQNFSSGLTNTMGSAAVNAGNMAAASGGDAIGAMINSHSSALSSTAGKAGTWAAGNMGSILGYGGAILSAVQGQYGSAIGSAIGTYILPGIGTMVGGMVGGLVDGFFDREPTTRRGQRSTAELVGGVWDRTAFDDRQSDESQEAARQLAEASVTAANRLFSQVGVDAAIDSFYAIMESSIKGDRQGVASGGTLRVGNQSLDFGIGHASDMTIRGFGGWSEEDMFTRLQTDIQMSILQALQLQVDQLPPMLAALIRDVDIRSLSAEAALNLISTFEMIILEVNGLISALDVMPFERLKGLSFDAAAAMLDAGGGLDAFTATLSGYFQNFHTEQEQFEWRIGNLNKSFENIGQLMPDMTKGLDQSVLSFRELLESIDPTTEAGARLYAQMINISGEFHAVATEWVRLNEVVEDTGDIIEEVVDHFGLALDRLREVSTGVQNTLQARNSAGSLADQLAQQLGLDQTFAPQREQELWSALRGISSASAEQNYMQAYGDLMLAFRQDNWGMDLEGFARRHYNEFGAEEGRYFGPDYAKQLTLAEQLTEIVTQRIVTEQEAAREELINAVRLRDIANSLQYYLRSLESSDLAPYTLGQKVTNAEQELYQLVSAARGGDEAALGRVQNSLQNALTLWREYGASGEDYRSAYHRLTAMVGDLAGSTLSDSERQIVQLEKATNISQSQLEQLQELHNFAMQAQAALDAQYQHEVTTMGRQVSLLESMGLDTIRLHDIATTLNALPAMIASHLMPFIPIVDGSHALGISRVPYDNYHAKLHAGERVYTAAQARAIDAGTYGVGTRSDGEMQAVVAKLDELTQQVRIQGQAQVVETKRSAELNANLVVKGMDESTQRNARDRNNQVAYGRKGVKYND
ncbi:MAG: tape measure protein [Acholeplasmataceae bacterium]|nr:tape measure protein [Acholeplasmataceae bacterium]